MYRRYEESRREFSTSIHQSMGLDPLRNRFIFVKTPFVVDVLSLVNPIVTVSRFSYHPSFYLMLSNAMRISASHSNECYSRSQSSLGHPRLPAAASLS